MQDNCVIVCSSLLYSVIKNNSQHELLFVDLASLGPVVQSIVSLTSSLRGQRIKCFTTI